MTGYDAAGNASAGTRRANGAPMVLPNPLKARARLVAGFGDGVGERPAAAADRPPRIRARPSAAA